MIGADDAAHIRGVLQRAVNTLPPANPQ